MNNKGIDSVFLHYGVRKEDMALIESFCVDNGIDVEWFKEHILRAYHEERNSETPGEEIKNEDKRNIKLLKKALKNL